MTPAQPGPMPCPYCGVIPDQISHETYGAVECLWRYCPVGPLVLRDHEEDSDGMALAIAAWNTRSSGAAVPPESVLSERALDAVEKVLRPYVAMIPAQCDGHGRVDVVETADGDEVCAICSGDGGSGELSYIATDTVAIAVCEALDDVVRITSAEYEAMIRVLKADAEHNAARAERAEVALRKATPSAAASGWVDAATPPKKAGHILVQDANSNVHQGAYSSMLGKGGGYGVVTKRTNVGIEYEHREGIVYWMPMPLPAEGEA